MGGDLDAAIDYYASVADDVVWSEADAADLAQYLSAGQWENDYQDPFPDQLGFDGGTYEHLTPAEQDALDDYFTEDCVRGVVDGDLIDASWFTGETAAVEEHYAAVKRSVATENAQYGQHELILLLSTFFEGMTDTMLSADIQRQEGHDAELLRVLDEDDPNHCRYEFRLSLAHDRGLLTDRAYDVIDGIRQQRNGLAHSLDSFDATLPYPDVRDHDAVEAARGDEDVNLLAAVRLYESMLGVQPSGSVLDWDRFGRLKQLSVGDLQDLGLEPDEALAIGPVDDPGIGQLGDYLVVRYGDGYHDQTVVPLRDRPTVLDDHHLPDNTADYDAVGQLDYDEITPEDWTLQEHAGTVAHTLASDNREITAILLHAFFEEHLNQVITEQLSLPQLRRTRFDDRVEAVRSFVQQGEADLGIDHGGISDQAALETLKRVHTARNDYAHALTAFAPGNGATLSDGDWDNAITIYEDLTGHAVR